MKNMNWYVLTGGPSSGKTETIKALSRLGYITFPETARVYIDQEIKKGKSIEEIRKDEAEFQNKVLELKIELEEEAPRDKIVFFDRGIPDTIAYCEAHGFASQKALNVSRTKKYKKIFFLEQLSFEKDYARIENDAIIKKLNKLLKKCYKDLGYEVVEIPVMSIQERVKKILSEVEQK
jgi:predicted ATPase